MDQRNYDQANQPVPGSREPVPYGQPANEYGNVQRTDSGVNQQSQQQQMNYAAQQQATQRPQRERPTIQVGGKDVPFYAAPRGHATEAVTRLAIRAREQERKQEDPGLPKVVSDDAIASARWVPMPPGGLHALASTLYPDDINNQESFDAHLFDLMTLNRDIVRDDTASTVGQFVRVPA